MTGSSVKGRMPHVLGSAALAVALAAGMAGVSASSAGAAAAGPEVTAAPYALTAATGLSWPELRQGSNSAWPQATVRSLQYLLNAHGAKLTVDGFFGPKTKAAVVAFQHAKGLTASGVVRRPPGGRSWSRCTAAVQDRRCARCRTRSTSGT